VACRRHVILLTLGYISTTGIYRIQKMCYTIVGVVWFTVFYSVQSETCFGVKISTVLIFERVWVRTKENGFSYRYRFELRDWVVASSSGPSHNWVCMTCKINRAVACDVKRGTKHSFVFKYVNLSINHLFCNPQTGQDRWDRYKVTTTEWSIYNVSNRKTVCATSHWKCSKN